MAQAKRVGAAPRSKQFKLNMSEEEYDRLKHFAGKAGMDLGAYVRRAIELAIRFDVGDVDVEAIGVQRLNQLIDTVTVLSSNVSSLERVTVAGFDSLLGLTRGDAYLFDEDVDG